MQSNVGLILEEKAALNRFAGQGENEPVDSE